MSKSGIPTIRILLIDDHLIVRAGLRMLIESQPGMSVIGEAADRAEALAMAAREQPDVILLDLLLRDESGLDFLTEFFSVASGARVLVLTGVRDIEEHRVALKLGAKGIVMKENATECLIHAIQQVNEGEIWLESSMMKELFAQPAPSEAKEINPETARIQSLTEREHDIISLVADGLKNRQIADRLFISEGTVRNYLTVIFEKLSVEDRFGLIVYAYRHGIVKSPAKGPASYHP